MVLVIVDPQWAAIKRLLICIIELESTLPLTAVGHAGNQDIDPDVLSPACRSLLNGTYVQSFHKRFASGRAPQSNPGG